MNNDKLLAKAKDLEIKCCGKIFWNSLDHEYCGQVNSFDSVLLCSDCKPNGKGWEGKWFKKEELK